jgi:hypothetical protein
MAELSTLRDNRKDAPSKYPMTPRCWDKKTYYETTVGWKATITHIPDGTNGLQETMISLLCAHLHLRLDVEQIELWIIESQTFHVP